jgi:hypothetical protein
MRDRVRRAAWIILGGGWLLPAFLGSQMRRRAAGLNSLDAETVSRAADLMHWITAGWLLMLVAYAAVHASRIRRGLK